MIDFDSYNTHMTTCIRNTRITGFFIRQRQILNRNNSDEDEDTDDEQNSNTQHQREITTLRSYFTRNSQVSGMTLHDLINDHFTGVSSPPTRSVIWFNIGSPSSTRLLEQPRDDGSTSYDINLRLGNMIGKVEVGLTEEQLKEVSYTTKLKEELNIEKETICPICQNNMLELDNACLLACGHIYCDTCIKTWLKKHKKCPVCMIDLEDAFCWGR
jgi:hypothetical protein